MRSLATELGPDRIRVNSIHPTNVDTPLIHHEEAYRVFRPDLENPGRDDIAAPLQTLHLLPVPWIEPDDVSEAVLYLTADSGRYVTGTTLTIDAGWTTK
jgi:NAD(P)-dependent dehydrogenase (short-subunit alcohol dehydrogenase family)